MKKREAGENCQTCRDEAENEQRVRKISRCAERMNQQAAVAPSSIFSDMACRA